MGNGEFPVSTITGKIIFTSRNKEIIMTEFLFQFFSVTLIRIYIPTEATLREKVVSLNHDSRTQSITAGNHRGATEITGQFHSQEQRAESMLTFSPLIQFMT